MIGEVVCFPTGEIGLVVDNVNEDNAFRFPVYVVYQNGRERLLRNYIHPEQWVEWKKILGK